MNLLFSFLCGLVFGLGLILAGMADPSKVLGFLDLAGPWDPSLAFVRGGASAVGAIAFAWGRRRELSWRGLPMQLQRMTEINLRLVAGSLLFGIGWGLAGICPGPALVLLGTGVWQGLIFVAAMLAGMGLYELWRRH